MSKHFNITTRPSKQKVGGTKHTKVIIEGEATLANAQNIKKEFVSVLEKNDSLEINCSSIQQMDLSCIQLLLALKQTAKSQNKTIQINCDLSADISKIVLNSGFKF